MKRMRRDCHTYPDEGRYRIIEAKDWGGYYVIIASDRHGEMRTYQYDGACDTKAGVEKELRAHSFAEIVKRYKEQYVYLECVEALR